MVRYNCPIEGKLYKTTEDIKVGSIITCPGCGYDLEFINLKEALAKVEVVVDTSEWVGTYKCPWDGGKYGLTEIDKVGDIITCLGCGCVLKIINIDGEKVIVEEVWEGTIKYECPEDGGIYELTEENEVGDIICCPGSGCTLKIVKFKGGIAIVEYVGYDEI